MGFKMIKIAQKLHTQQ